MACADWIGKSERLSTASDLDQTSATQLCLCAMSMVHFDAGNIGRRATNSVHGLEITDCRILEESLRFARKAAALLDSAVPDLLVARCCIALHNEDEGFVSG